MHNIQDSLEDVMTFLNGSLVPLGIRNNYVVDFSSMVKQNQLTNVEAITLSRLTILDLTVNSLIFLFPIHSGAMTVKNSKEFKDGIPESKLSVSKIKLPCNPKYLWICDYANDKSQNWVRKMPLMVDPYSSKPLSIGQMILPNETFKNFMLMRWDNVN